MSENGRPAATKRASARPQKENLLLSFVSGTSSRPLLFATLDEVLKQAVAAGPERTAIVAPQQMARHTFREFDALVERVARGFVACGLEPGERVGIWAPNCVEWVLTMFAAARAGLILVNINPAYRTYELEHALRLVGCRALVFAPGYKSSNYLTILEELIPELADAAPGLLRAARLPDLRLLVRIADDVAAGSVSFKDLAAQGERLHPAALAAARVRNDPDQPVNIQFTSGTTGSPKGATLTHFNIVNNGFFVGESMRLTAEDRLCIPVPLYHCFGMVLGVLAAMTHGAASIFPGEGFDPLLTLQTVQRERCTALHGVPTMFIAELEHPRFGDFDLTSLRTGIMAGAPCPIAVMRRVVTDMHMPEVSICYGMTETSPVSFQSACDDPLERRVTTVGRIHPHVQVKIVDDAGRVTRRGTPGELLTRGYSVMRGYWGQPGRTAEAIDYPREIEEFLYRHPSIIDVAVVGVPDHKYGEEICACVRLRHGAHATAEDIREFCRGKIAHYKVPRYVRFFESFPQTVTGKVQKYLLREQLQCELGRAEEQHA